MPANRQRQLASRKRQMPSVSASMRQRWRNCLRSWPAGRSVPWRPPQPGPRRILCRSCTNIPAHKIVSTTTGHNPLHQAQTRCKLERRISQGEHQTFRTDQRISLTWLRFGISMKPSPTHRRFASAIKGSQEHHSILCTKNSETNSKRSP